MGWGYIRNMPSDYDHRRPFLMMPIEPDKARADFNSDGAVDFADFAVLADQWLIRPG